MAAEQKSNTVTYLPIHVSEECAENLLKMGLIVEVESINSAALVLTKLPDALAIFNQRINIIEGKLAKINGEVQ